MLGLMLDWLGAPIDPARAHDVAGPVMWHGRLMVLAWAILIPLGVLIARFGKILPGQDWPHRLDNTVWWAAHRGLQYIGGAATLAALALILSATEFGASGRHANLGWVVAALAASQYLAGWLRGSKGGPTDPAPDGTLAGDHYDMTPRRRVFEYFHKLVGYVLLALALWACGTGLWLANAPLWMWLVLGLWFSLLVGAFVVLQRAGWANDTYQAIWGPSPEHPGNRIPPIGWGIRRPGEARPGGERMTGRDFWLSLK